MVERYCSRLLVPIFASVLGDRSGSSVAWFDAIANGKKRRESQSNMSGPTDMGRKPFFYYYRPNPSAGTRHVRRMVPHLTVAAHNCGGAPPLSSAAQSCAVSYVWLLTEIRYVTRAAAQRRARHTRHAVLTAHTHRQTDNF